MTTSGTVGATQIDVGKIIEHALRRCKVKPAAQTPEIVTTAKESLYLFLTSLSNRGLNLWCIETAYQGLTSGRATYAMPIGTTDVLSVVYSTPTRASGTDTTTATSVATELDSATTIRRVGVKMTSVTASDTLTLASSGDGLVWTTLRTEAKTDWAADTWYWFELSTQASALHFRASFGAAATFEQFYLASSVRDLPMSQWNRDTYSCIPNKAQTGNPATCYFLEKLLTPQLTLWPVPNNTFDHLTLYVQRQPEDVGGLSNTLDIPQRWVDGVIWQLAARLCFELDIVPPEVIPGVLQMADKNLIEAEHGESDGSSIYLQPNIGVYSR